MKLIPVTLHNQNYCKLYYFLTLCYIFFVCYLKGAWLLKTRALTEQVYVDEVEVDEEGIAEILMDDTSIAQISRKLCEMNN